MESATDRKPWQRGRDASAAPPADTEIPAKEVASVPAFIASAFGKADLERRARLLARLLSSVGPLALLVIGGGVFAKYLPNARWREVPISLEDATRVTSSQVYDLVRYVRQSNPHLVDGLLAALVQDRATLTALGVSVAAMTIRHVTGRRGWRPESSIKKLRGP
jgi:hypothetical protein